MIIHLPPVLYHQKKITKQVKKCEPKPILAQGSDDESIDNPMKIDFIQKKEPFTSIATIKYKIRYLRIPAMVLDSGSEITIITEDIILRIRANVDKSIKYDLSGIATIPVESIGIKYKCAIDWDKEELKIPYNGKDLIFSVTMHEVKNKLEVNYVNITPECNDLLALDCISQDDDGILKKIYEL
ncbi:hypothetical protein RclHR1_18720004 [Rhizophagus clarus]|uniref:Uncharacterized protein n=1 Tax=Rhizophagus clarus TaxID=94130 RepID=A0A2Z6QMC3_9GLOM|nr:hypothetical protein RclHR1_18720004 [Rhizophagus clarus]